MEAADSNDCGDLKEENRHLRHVCTYLQSPITCRESLAVDVAGITVRVYVCYRTYVHAKISLLRLHEPPHCPDMRGRALLC